MRHIEIGLNTPPEDWIKRADIITKQLLKAIESDRDKIINDNESIWKELRDFLKQMSHNKCWYTEARDSASYAHVDHFRPKGRVTDINNNKSSGYWWLAFEWTNYRYCCSKPNCRKNDKFAVLNNKANKPEDSIEDEMHYLLDPTKLSDTLLLSYYHDGSAKPLGSNMNDWDYQRADYTIKTLYLNEPDLSEARKNTWKKCADLIQEINSLFAKISMTPSVAIGQKRDDKMVELRKHLSDDSEFVSVAKECCMSSGYKWAMKLAV